MWVMCELYSSGSMFFLSYRKMGSNQSMVQAGVDAQRYMLPLDQQLGFVSPPRTTPQFARSYAMANSVRSQNGPVHHTEAYNIPQRFVVDYSKKLGAGGFGAIYPVTDTKTGKVYAMKAVDKSKTDQISLEDMAREAEITKSLDHPGVVKVLYTFEDPKYFYIIMDMYEGGDLYKLMRKYQRLNECVAYLIMMQLVPAIYYLHQRGIVHRDIKLENIVFTNEYDLKIGIIDFGLASVRFPNDPLITTIVGSAHYIAPEVATGKPNKGYPADVWALGVTLYAMTTGKFLSPANMDNDRAYMTAVVMNPIEIPQGISPALRDLLSKMLDKNPDTRITLEGVWEHPWMREWRQYIVHHKCPPSIPHNPNQTQRNQGVRLSRNVAGGPDPVPVTHWNPNDGAEQSVAEARSNASMMQLTTMDMYPITPP